MQKRNAAPAFERVIGFFRRMGSRKGIFVRRRALSDQSYVSAAANWA